MKVADHSQGDPALAPGHAGAWSAPYGVERRIRKDETGGRDGGERGGGSVRKGCSRNILASPRSSVPPLSRQAYVCRSETCAGVTGAKRHAMPRVHLLHTSNAMEHAIPRRRPASTARMLKNNNRALEHIKPSRMAHPTYCKSDDLRHRFSQQECQLLERPPPPGHRTP